MELHRVLQAHRRLAALRGDDAGDVAEVAAGGGSAPSRSGATTGGIDVPAVATWIPQGALAVGLGTALCSPADIRQRDRGPVDGVRGVLRTRTRA